MTPASRDPRVVAYGVVAVALVGVALATGEPVLAAGAAPFVVVLMMALRDLQPRDIDVSVAASSLTPLEGDDVTLTITVPRQPGVSTHVELELGPSWDAEDRDQLHLMAPPDGTDAVLGPATDGGYWLVALRRGGLARQRMFDGARWSSPYALADSVKALTGRRIALTDTLADVDTAADLRHRF